MAKVFNNNKKELSEDYEEVSCETGYRVVRKKRHEHIDADEVYRLAQIDATPREIAHVMQVDYATLTRHYSDVIDAGKADLRVKLRKKLSSLALAGDKLALKILAESELGYGSKSTIEQTVTVSPDIELFKKLAQVDSTQIVSLLIKASENESANVVH